MTAFAEFFESATGQKPYPYQERFAEAVPLPNLLRAPTGAGKTAAAVLGWLWHRETEKQHTPRRLIYCLPMRVLVEQSEREAKKWIHALHDGKLLKEKVDVHVLMGGVQTKKWYLHPEKPAILIGTQDMLLSRALNRGYAASRFHWPIDFGLLNNDCLWVFDEPQLMASGVSTSAQLAGLRKQLDVLGNCSSVWMSATLEPGWLDTIDFAGKCTAAPLELSAEDYDPLRPLHTRMTAEKTIAPLGATATKDMKEVARAVVDKHIASTQTLVILNTVERAKAVFAAIKKDPKAPNDVLLIHSRFRPAERRKLNEQLTRNATDRIVIATQVVEAGVDISARTLITELAPWASIVQRIGRCNRTGADGPGRVFWIDVIGDDKAARPYTAAELSFARLQLEKLAGKGVSPKELDDFKRNEGIILPFTHTHVLRRRDLLDLFDTSPDLSGNDIDISRFIRGDDPETDVQVFWRVFTTADLEEQRSPGRDELCSVPVGQARDFLAKIKEKKSLSGYVWDHIEDEWRELKPAQVRPGLVILLHAEAGGYDNDLGWDIEAPLPVTPLPPPDEKPEGTRDDPLSTGPAFTIAQHTDHVCTELESLLGALGSLTGEWPSLLRQAARWHDAGKAHWAFQQGMRTANPALPPNELWAKSGVKKRLRHGRKFFRHELASALAALQHGLPFKAAYVIGAHHGKVRLSIRALPGEEQPKNDVPFALGVHDGDDLHTADCGGNVFCPDTKLDLTPMKLGGESSWTANALKLLAELGPFRLAYLEALLRAADQRASEKEATHAGY
jgi:CRISPR-associated endonuclease/helicase Cas3